MVDQDQYSQIEIMVLTIKLVNPSRSNELLVKKIIVKLMIETMTTNHHPNLDFHLIFYRFEEKYSYRKVRTVARIEMCGTMFF
jgi:hypothetical protein